MDPSIWCYRGSVVRLSHLCCHLGPQRSSWSPALLPIDRPDQHRPEPGTQPCPEERECTAAAGAPEQGAQGQAAGDGGHGQVQVQGLHQCAGGQDRTAGGAAGQRDKVGAPRLSPGRVYSPSAVLSLSPVRSSFLSPESQKLFPLLLTGSPPFHWGLVEFTWEPTAHL